MAEIIRGDSTDIHADLALQFGLEHLLIFGHCVVQPQLRRLRRAQRTETSASDKAAPPGLRIEEEGIMGEVSGESNLPRQVRETDGAERSAKLEERSHFRLLRGSLLSFSGGFGCTLRQPPARIHMNCKLSI